MSEFLALSYCRFRSGNRVFLLYSDLDSDFKPSGGQIHKSDMVPNDVAAPFGGARCE